MKDYRQAAAHAIAETQFLSADKALALLATPPKPEMGDIALPCFALARERKQNPKVIAEELAAALGAPSGFRSVTPAGPYVNFTIDPAALVADVLTEVRRDDRVFGASEAGVGKTVLIDYSSPNIAKPLAIHHIRSTIIGAALARLYAFLGYRVERINYLGDWGTNFGQLMVSYKRQEAAAPDREVSIHSLLQMYIQFHRDADGEDDLQDEAKEWFARLEAGDEEALRLWRLFRAESLKSFKALYERLGVDFDHYDIGESFFHERDETGRTRMDETLERLREKGITEKSEGATVVKFADETGKSTMPPCLLVKSDGTTLYATRDLASAEYRWERWRFDRCLYVVANQQELHFRQVFAVLQRLGHPCAERLEHIKFGMLSFGDGVFDDSAPGPGGRVTGSTRRGHIVFLEDVLDRARKKAKTLVLENARDDAVREAADELAETIGVGAIVFNEVAQRRQKDVVFTWDRALNLQGDSGPYLQYTHARLSSVLERYGKPLPADVDAAPLGTEREIEVAKALARFPAAVAGAVAENEPSLVSDYLLELCAVFNRFFTDKANHRIIGPDAALTAARVALVDAVRRVLRTGLNLLGLQAPERM